MMRFRNPTGPTATSSRSQPTTEDQPRRAPDPPKRGPRRPHVRVRGGRLIAPGRYPRTQVTTLIVYSSPAAPANRIIARIQPSDFQVEVATLRPRLRPEGLAPPGQSGSCETPGNGPLRATQYGDPAQPTASPMRRGASPVGRAHWSQLRDEGLRRPPP